MRSEPPGEQAMTRTHAPGGFMTGCVAFTLLLKTARALGLTIAPAVVGRADVIVE